MRAKISSTCGILVVLLLGFSPAIATAQSEVSGHAKVSSSGDNISTSQISVVASLDDNGEVGDAHGTIIFVGATAFIPGSPQPAGPADPWVIEVDKITFTGRTAKVCGVVVQAVFPEEIGIEQCVSFTDNSGTGDPDAIGVVGVIDPPQPIEAGNIIVR